MVGKKLPAAPPGGGMTDPRAGIQKGVKMMLSQLPEKRLSRYIDSTLCRHSAFCWLLSLLAVYNCKQSVPKRSPYKIMELQIRLGANLAPPSARTDSVTIKGNMRYDCNEISFNASSRWELFLTHGPQCRVSDLLQSKDRTVPVSESEFGAIDVDVNINTWACKGPMYKSRNMYNVITTVQSTSVWTVQFFSGYSASACDSLANLLLSEGATNLQFARKFRIANTLEVRSLWAGCGESVAHEGNRMKHGMPSQMQG